MFYSWPCTDSSEQSLRKLTPQSHHLSLDLIYMQRSPVKQRGWCIHVALWNLPQGPVMCLGKRWSHHSVLLTPGFYSQKWDVVVIRLKDEIREGVATIIHWWRLIKWSLPNLKLMMASILLKPPLGGRWPVIYTCNWVSFTWKDKDDSPLLRLRRRALHAQFALLIVEQTTVCASSIFCHSACFVFPGSLPRPLKPILLCSESKE